MKFWKHYLHALVPLVVAFAIYSALVVPRLEPTIKPATAKWVHHQTPLNTGLQWWESFFLEDSWQRRSPLIIEREQCILLYQEREQLTDTRWRFKPLTIVIPQSSGANGNKRAIFIENPKGAEIQFKSAFDWTSGQPPPVVNGQLIGDIKIYSPADEATGSGELLIETQDMRIDKRQIWTDKQIKMKLGDSYVEGRYLSIFMDQDLLAENSTQSVTKSESPFHGLDYLQLFYVDRVHMNLQPGGLWPRQGTSEGALSPAHATLDCRGRFLFQFHQSQATFLDGVHMEHHVQGLPVDTFDCNELKLAVGWPETKPQSSSNTGTPTEVASQESKAKNQWRLNRLEATGLPGRDANDQSRWLKLLAPGMQAEAHGQHLVMDFVNGMVSLSNTLPGTAPRNSSRVFLKREAFQVSSPQVQYQNPDLINTQGEQQLNRLGWVLADGIGVAQIESHEEVWVLKWSKRLVVRPHEHRDLIQIEGGANISSSQRGRFIAEQLDMWVLPVDAPLARRLKPYYADQELPSFVPDAIQATGDVTVSTAELNAQVQAMAIRFYYPDASDPTLDERMRPPRAAVVKAPGPGMARLDAVSTSPSPIAIHPSSPLLGSSREQPGALAGTPSIKNPMTQPDRSGKKDPIVVSGKNLEAEVVRLGTQSLVDSMTLEGSFTLTREHFSEESPWPLTATGDRLVLQNESQDVSNIHLIGQPAKIAVGSGWVVAKELQLSQNDQMFWIDHPGELLIPVEALEPAEAPSMVPSSAIPSLLNAGNPRKNDRGALANGKMQWHSAPRVQWGERMTFDGRIARFGGGVTLDCRMQNGNEALWHVLATAQTMTLDLANRVPMRIQPKVGPSASGSTTPPVRADLQVVRLDGDVEVKAVQTDLQGMRLSAEDMHVPRLEFHVPNRTVIGFGPGQLWSRRHGGSSPMDMSGTGPGASRPAPSPKGSPSETLQCLHLTFLGRMEGALDQRLVSFFDKIDALLGPIATWNDSIDVRNAETLALNQTRLVCDQLNLFDASGLSYNQSRRDASKSAWELDAMGSAQLASRTDSGEVVVDASRIVYAAMDDAVRIEGTTRKAATIRRLPQGASPDRLEEIHVSSASMRLKTGQLDAQIRKIEGVLPPQFQRPGAPGGGPANTQPPTNNPGAPSAGSAVLPSARAFNPLQPIPGRK
ncbi:MAG: hypothetical protein WCI02_09215 [Planctomycetota bacterium]